MTLRFWGIPLTPNFCGLYCPSTHTPHTHTHTHTQQQKIWILDMSLPSSHFGCIQKLIFPTTDSFCLIEVTHTRIPSISISFVESRSNHLSSEDNFGTISQWELSIFTNSFLFHFYTGWHQSSNLDRRIPIWCYIRLHSHCTHYWHKRCRGCRSCLEI